MSDSSESTSEVGPLAFDADGSLRTETDACYTCSSCNMNCPVAAVDDSFPGPKFQGPEQWRLRTDAEFSIDPSIRDCSNCLRCDSACPSDVPLSAMHNEARAEFVRSDLSKWSLSYWRDRLLANYRTSAALASKLPRLANALLDFGPLRWLLDRGFGITSEREFPTFAQTTFRDWWANRGGHQASLDRARAARRRRGEPREANKTVAYFHGCYANYNTPAVGKAMVRVFEHFGYAVRVPSQRCSGTPMFANGMLADAKRHARTNVDSFVPLIEDGVPVITTCSSCSLALRKEYPELIDLAGIETLAANTWDAMEYLRREVDIEAALQNVSVSEAAFGDLVYHAPCHARDQGLDGQPLELFADLTGARPEDVGDSCSGISGTYGWKSEHYETSMAIGEEMFEGMDASAGETGLTECPTCASQMEHGTGYEVRHPLEVLEAALVSNSSQS